MSVVVKKPHINQVEILIGGDYNRQFVVNRETAKGLIKILQQCEVQSIEEVERIHVNDVFPELGDNQKRPGTILAGLRQRENLTQVKLANKIGVPQSHISQMEHGTRPIGKQMAKRIAKVLKTDYRIFLF